MTIHNKTENSTAHQITQHATATPCPSGHPPIDESRIYREHHITGAN